MNRITEIKLLMSNQKEAEIKALRGIGDLRVIPPLQHLVVEDGQWTNMPADARKQALLAFRCSSHGEFENILHIFQKILLRTEAYELQNFFEPY